MIDESCYWKNDLLKQADALRSRKKQRRWPETSFARLEQTLMLGFYSIRKLIEASKLSCATFSAMRNTAVGDLLVVLILKDICERPAASEPC